MSVLAAGNVSRISSCPRAPRPADASRAVPLVPRLGFDSFLCEGLSLPAGPPPFPPGAGGDLRFRGNVPSRVDADKRVSFHRCALLRKLRLDAVAIPSEPVCRHGPADSGLARGPDVLPRMAQCPGALQVRLLVVGGQDLPVGQRRLLGHDPVVQDTKRRGGGPHRRRALARLPGPGRSESRDAPCTCSSGVPCS